MLNAEKLGMVQMKKIRNSTWIKKYIPFILLFIAIIAVSFAAPLVVLIQEYDVSSEIVAMYRTLFAGIGAFVISIMNKDVKWLKSEKTIKRYHWIVLSGILLGIHFATWFLSLRFISVAISTTLVDTVPIFMAIFGFLFFRERVNWIGVTGIVIAIVGSVLLTLSTSQSSDSINPLLGGILAVIGAVTVSFYFLIGKKILKDSPLWPYFGVVNIVSAVALMFYNLVQRNSFVFPGKALLFIILMALGPSLIGHATYNYSLRKIPAFIVGTVIVAEPIGATILGIVFLDQIPELITLAYALIVIIGIGLTSISQNLKKTKEELGAE